MLLLFCSEYEAPVDTAAPDVVGLLSTAAEILIAAAGFEVALAYASSDFFFPDVVMLQSPVAGTLLSAGAVITITISTGVGGRVDHFHVEPLEYVMRVRVH